MATLPLTLPRAESDTWTGDMSAYAIPTPTLGTTSATSMVTDPLQANISAAPALQKLSEIVSAINQRAWTSAPGRQEQLGNIQRWQAGELDPSIYAQEAGRAAQMYGGGGFGVDSPAWQSAVQRALVTNRQALQEKGGEAMDRFYSGMPTTDVGRFTLTPTDYASVQDQQRARELQLAELQQKGALTQAELAQARALESGRLAQERALQTERLVQERALQEQEMALRQQQYQQQYNLERSKQLADLYAKGYTASGRRIPLEQRSEFGYFDVAGRWHAGTPRSAIGGF